MFILYYYNYPFIKLLCFCFWSFCMLWFQFLSLFFFFLFGFYPCFSVFLYVFLCFSICSFTDRSDSTLHAFTLSLPLSLCVCFLTNKYFSLYPNFCCNCLSCLFVFLVKLFNEQMKLITYFLRENFNQKYKWTHECSFFVIAVP